MRVLLAGYLFITPLLSFSGSRWAGVIPFAFEPVVFWLMALACTAAGGATLVSSPAARSLVLLTQVPQVIAISSPWLVLIFSFGLAVPFSVFLDSNTGEFVPALSSSSKMHLILMVSPQERPPEEQGVAVNIVPVLAVMAVHFLSKRGRHDSQRPVQAVPIPPALGK